MSQEPIISSFTAIKGPLVTETYAIFAEWDFRRTKRENLENSSTLAMLAAGSEKRLADISRVIFRRFQIPGRDVPLIFLAQRHCQIDVWKTVLLWHLSQQDTLLRRFLEDWLFDAFRQGLSELRAHPLPAFIADLRRHSGSLPFKEGTLKRAACGLLKITADFGLTEGAGVHRFRPFALPDAALLYLLHAIADRHAAGQRIIEAQDWRRFLMTPGDVERQLFRLHQLHLLDYQVAGSLSQLTLPCATALEFAEQYKP